MAIYETLPTEPPVTLRPLRAADLESLAERCFPEMPFEDVRENVEEDLQRAHAGTGLTLVAEANGEAVSTLKMTRDGDAAWIHNVRTASAFRGMGLAPRMIELLAKQLREEGIRRMCAHVRADNAAARRAYEKAGMRNEGADGMRGEQLRYVRDLSA